MSLIKKLVGETAIYGLSSIIGRALNFLLVPIYTRVLNTAEYGEVAELYALVGLFIIVFTYRMETGFFRFGTPTQDRDRAYSTTSFMLLITTPIFCLLLMAFAQPIAEWLKYPDHANYIRWLVLILGLDALAAIPFARLRLDNRPWTFAGIKLINIGINIGANCFFLLLCPYLAGRGWDIAWFYDANMGVGYVIISNLLASAVTLLLLIPSYFKIKLVFDKKLLIKVLRYTLPLILVGFAGVINEVLDRILLKWLLPYSAAENQALVGIYSASYKMAMLMTLFTQAFNYAAEPFFFRNADRSDSMKVYAQVALIFAIVGCVGFLGILFYIDVFQHFIGAEFREGLVIVPILLLANLCLGLYYNFAIWYKLKDKTMIGAYIALGGAAITILLNIWLIPILGYMGSAWATLACYAMMSTVCYSVGQRYYPVPYPVVKIVLYMLMAVLFFQINLIFRDHFLSAMPWLLYSLSTILLLIFLGIAIYTERNLLLGIMRNKT